MATKILKYRISYEFYDPDQSADAVQSQNFGERTRETQSGKVEKIHQTVGTTEEALRLGESGGAATMFIENTEPSTGNFVEIRLPGTGAGNDSVKVYPGQVEKIELGSDATAPFAIADTAPVDLRIHLIPIS